MTPINVVLYTTAFGQSHAALVAHDNKKDVLKILKNRFGEGHIQSMEQMQIKGNFSLIQRNDGMVFIRKVDKT